MLLPKLGQVLHHAQATADERQKKGTLHTSLREIHKCTCKGGKAASSLTRQHAAGL